MARAPGPWQAARDCGDTPYQAVYAEDGRKLALVFRPEDAPLMAAAPDLLASAEAALRLWDNGGNPAGAFHNMRAAIEKAKGAR